MAKLTRYTMTPFASTAGSNQIAQFGSAAAASFPGTPAAYSGTTATPTNIQALSNYLEGWFAAVDGEFNPAIEDMNAICWLFAYMLCYLMQTGVPEWDSGTTYYIGSVVNDGTGNLYTSLTDANLNNALTSTTNWIRNGRAASITALTSADSPYTMTGREQAIQIDATSGAVAITLPARSTFQGVTYSFDRIDSTIANAVTISRAGSDTFAEPTFTTSYPVGIYESYQFFAGTTKWKVR